MTSSHPVKPEGISDDLTEELGELSPADLRELATYAVQLAAVKERQTSSTTSAEQKGSQSHTDTPERQSAGGSRPRDEPNPDCPADVPAKATITIKEINGNRYYYWQWRDGDKVKSQYKGPVQNS